MAKQSELLTGKERELLSLLAKVMQSFVSIIGDESTRQQDMSEAIVAIHVLQRMVGAQAAARAFPAEFRLLGERIKSGIPKETTS